MAAWQKQGDQENRRSKLIRLVVVALSTVAAILATVGVDRIAGVVVSDPLRTSGLIFHPHSTATYRTPEFTFTASTNALGFRDHEFTQGRSPACRVLAIGDSFTFGWGVSLEESWPKVLETTLQQAGVGVEVANLGFPGGSPLDYANIAARAVPELRPDLVLIGVLQGDDLEQLRSVAAPDDGWRREVSKVLHRVEDTLYPHLTMLAGLVDESLHHRPNALSVNTTWKEQAQAGLASLSPAEKARYRRIDAGIRRAFEAGDLNPALIVSAVRHPEYFLATFELDRPETQGLIREMSDQLGRIRRAAESERARAAVASVPFGIYVSPWMFDTWRTRYGFELDPRMLTSNSPDEAIRLAADGARLPVHMVTPAFRAWSGPPIYFELDGHPNAAGHRLYAQQLAPAVAATLRALPPPCRS